MEKKRALMKNLLSTMYFIASINVCLFQAFSLDNQYRISAECVTVLAIHY